MANSSSIPPADIPLDGYMNNLFELPEERVGDDQMATSIRQNPLPRPGTPARIQFDLKNQMTIEVRFKIYTPTAVDVPIPSQSTDKVGAGKKPVKSIKLNLIDSKKTKTKYFEIKNCLFGKSLNEFKIMVADACEAHQAGMKIILLNRDFLPELKWKTTVGRSKQVLESAVQWQAFVGALEKSIKKHGLVVIENENVEVQSQEENTQSAIEMLIEQTNGGGAKKNESNVSNKDADLHIMANEIFGQAGIGGYAGGDGTVLSLPWDPSFRYRLTYNAAWIWAKGVMANIATQYLPPNTREFNQEVKKSEWKHPDMGVDARVQMRLQGHPRKLLQIKGTSNSKGASSSSRKSNRVTKSKPYLNRPTDNRIITDFFGPTEAKPDLKKNKIEKTNNRFIDLTKPDDSKPDLKKLINKRIIDLTEPEDSKPDMKKLIQSIDPTESKPNFNKIKIENQLGHSIDEPMCLSSDPESENSNSEVEDSETDENKVEDSDIDVTKIEESDDFESESDIEIPTKNHSVEMELFLADCKIPYQDDKTRSLLKEAGIVSWTDLIPSVQMTESTLTTKGIDRQIASRLMDEAKARYYTD